MSDEGDHLDTRTTPPPAGDEAEVLVGFLEFHRETFRRKIAGLDSAALDRPLPPSTMTLGGMTKHLAWVEDWWLPQVFAGEPEVEPWASADWETDADWDWHSASQDDPATLHALLDTAVTRARRVLPEALRAPAGLDAPAHEQARLPGLRLRWIVVHLVEEYARHNGHADLLREAIDGQVGE